MNFSYHNGLVQLVNQRGIIVKKRKVFSLCRRNRMVTQYRTDGSNTVPYRSKVFDLLRLY